MSGSSAPDSREEALGLGPSPELANPAVVVSAMAAGALEAARAPTLTLTRSEGLAKRALDLVSAGLGLLLLSPFAVLIALAIRIDSKGPALFRQMRIGRDGAPFMMVKFRTMVNGAHEQRSALAALNETSGVFKLRHDPRVTRVGRVLRRSALDELPQLINVLLGLMSLVGPRPLVPEEDRLIVGHHRQRLSLRPGLTGPWQAQWPRLPLSDMVELDCSYVTNWSLWLDLKIIATTLLQVARLRGF